MDEAVGAALINGLFGFAGNVQQNHYNKELMEYQNQWNLDMWNRQNEYNAPINVMKRLTDAGINPRAYQQLGQFANASQPREAAQSSRISELSAFQQTMMNAAQINLMNKQAEKEEAQADNLGSQSQHYQALTNKVGEEITSIQANTSLTNVQKEKAQQQILTDWFNTCVNAWVYGVDLTYTPPFMSSMAGQFAVDNIRDGLSVHSDMQGIGWRMKKGQEMKQNFDNSSLAFKLNYWQKYGHELGQYSDDMLKTQLNQRERALDINSYTARSQWNLGNYNLQQKERQRYQDYEIWKANHSQRRMEHYDNFWKFW